MAEEALVLYNILHTGQSQFSKYTHKLNNHTITNHIKYQIGIFAGRKVWFHYIKDQNKIL